RRSLMKYPQGVRDQLANCMLLTTDENGPAGKTDTPPEQWFARGRFASDEEHSSYLAMHLIPTNPDLWTMDRFEDFVKARQQLILDKFKPMLQTAPEGAA